ncbi:CsbD family protein [Streptomyces sp. NPDC051684]|uniref:CsbD family protein n=1 Tax=Streptomyces sp. NPDC051684 TaxID=3365670 RepID=UPI00379C0E2D
MTASEKAKAQAERTAGAVMEATGRAVGNERLTAKGRAAKAMGSARQGKESAKDFGNQ